MNSFSSVPALAAVLGVVWLALTVRGLQRGELRAGEGTALIAWLLVMAVWAVLTSMYSLRGVYRTDSFLRSLPGFWLPFIPMAATATLLVSPQFRRGIFKLLLVNERAFVFLQGLRALAIGGVTKGLMGHLPPSFALPIGIPDLLFGLSAVWLGRRLSQYRPSGKLLIAWNMLGVAVIQPGRAGVAGVSDGPCTDADRAGVHHIERDARRRALAHERAATRSSVKFHGFGAREAFVPCRRGSRRRVCAGLFPS